MSDRDPLFPEPAATDNPTPATNGAANHENDTPSIDDQVPSGEVPSIDDQVPGGEDLDSEDGDSQNSELPFRMPTGAPEGTRARGSLAEDFSDAPASPDDAIDAALSSAVANLQQSDNTDSHSTDSHSTDVAASSEENAVAEISPEEEWPENNYGYEWTPPENYGEQELSDETPRIMPTWEESEVDPAYNSESATEHPIHASYGGEIIPPTTPPGNLALPDGNDEPDVPSPYDENAPANDRELGLIEHLTELRTRMMWSVSAILVAMMATWQFTPQIEALMIRPVKTILERNNVSGFIQTLEPTEAFMIYFNTSLIAAVVVVMPFLLFQIWRFIEPAMTKRERRFTGILVPFSSVLFFMGCALGYSVSPLFFQFFVQFQPPGTMANYSYASVSVLLAKMLLVFGVTFQVPVFTIFLNKSGMVSRNVLIEYWRHVVVVIFVVVAVLTPTWDPVTMVVCALPPCLLYGGSIWLVKWL